MTEVNRNTAISLSTNITEDKYFYLTNSYYNPYIYFLLEDNAFSLNTSDIKYCQTTTYNLYSMKTIALSDCTFNPITYYSNQTSSNPKKYYYKLFSNRSYYHTIIYYSGSHNYGSLNVISKDYDLLLTIKMTKVNRNSHTSLPTNTSDDKYFYLTNRDYYLHSSYIYILLEDNNFGLNYSNVKYCQTKNNPDSYPEGAASGCNFYTLEYYRTAHYSNSAKFYYKYYVNSSVSYSVISYNGNYSSGSLYVTSDYKELSDEDSSDELSTVAIIFIVLASLIVLAVVIFLLVRCCARRRNNKIDPLNQPYVAAPPVSHPMNQQINNPAAPYQAY